MISEKNFLSLDRVHAYTISSELADVIWKSVSSWDPFNKNTLGIQYVRSTDSIAGNVAEGFGRFYKKDKQKFFYNSRGSLYESLHWTEKAKQRKLLSQAEYEHIKNTLDKLPRELHWLIKITEEKLQK